MALRERAQRVRRRGEEKRRVWKPSADDATYKRYRYWLAKTHKRQPEQENFCHYWRVVILWSTLQQLKGPADFAVPCVVIVVVLAAIAEIVYEFVIHPRYAAALILAIMVILYFCWCGVIALEDNYEFGTREASENGNWLYRKSWPVKLLVNLLALPGAVSFFVIFWPMIKLHQHKVASRCLHRALRFLFLSHLGAGGWVIYIHAWLAFPVAATVLSIVPTPFRTASQWTLLGILVPSVVVIALLVYAKKAYDARSEERIAQIVTARPARRKVTSPTRSHKRPNRLRHGVGDFGGLAWQLILMIDRKACPLVELPKIDGMSTSQ